MSDLDRHQDPPPAAPQRRTVAALPHSGGHRARRGRRPAYHTVSHPSIKHPPSRRPGNYRCGRSSPVPVPWTEIRHPTVVPQPAPRGNLRRLGMDRGARRRRTDPGLRVRPRRTRPQRTLTPRPGHTRPPPTYTPCSTRPHHRATDHRWTLPRRPLRARLHRPISTTGRRDRLLRRHPTHRVHRPARLPRLLRMSPPHPPSPAGRRLESQTRHLRQPPGPPAQERDQARADTSTAGQAEADGDEARDVPTMANASPGPISATYRSPSHRPRGRTNRLARRSK